MSRKSYSSSWWDDAPKEPRPRVYNDGLPSLVEHAFDRDVLKRVCEMDEIEFGDYYGMSTTQVPQSVPDDFYFFKDNGANVLAVAHLDTVGLADQRTANFVETQDGLVVYSRALDDRLGAYVILELLPALGITYDILLTVGEENGKSTAAFFEPPKEYDWMIEFDRGGTDVVMYQYDDSDMRSLVRESGARVGDGIFSDICYLEHLGTKGFNWGVGYQDYHGPRAHAFLDDTFMMVAHYLRFHQANSGVAFPHVEEPASSWWGYRPSSSSWTSYYEDMEEERECDSVFGSGHYHDDQECAYVMAEMHEKDVEDIDEIEVEVVDVARDVG